jgi:hypothetical protein
MKICRPSAPGPEAKISRGHPRSGGRRGHLRRLRVSDSVPSTHIGRDRPMSWLISAAEGPTNLCQDRELAVIGRFHPGMASALQMA